MNALLNVNVQATLSRIELIQSELDHRGGRPDNKFWLDVANVMMDFSTAESIVLFTELHACIPDDSSIKDLHARKYKEWLTKHK